MWAMVAPSRLAVFLLAASVVVAACSSGDDATDVTAAGTATPSLDTTTSTAPTTTPATTTTTTPPTTVPVTLASTTTTTLPPTTTTTEPLSVQELTLRVDGLGSARFGAAPEGVIDYVTSILGGNTGDTGWVDPFTFAACEGDVARRVDWGSLSLLFSDFSDFAQGRRHFIGYEYGRIGQIGDEPVGLRTEGGTALGSRVVDLLAEFPEAAINQGEEEINIPPNFYVNDYFYGLLTGVEADDIVTVVFGGDGCGE